MKYSKKTIYYQDAQFLVTSSKARAPRKTYRVDKIEKVSLRRDPFFISIAITLFAVLFALKFGRKDTELPTIILSFSIATSYFLRKFGLLYITSKAISELAFIGLYDRLENVRDAIELSMHKEDNGIYLLDEDEND